MLICCIQYRGYNMLYYNPYKFLGHRKLYSVIFPKILFKIKKLTDYFVYNVIFLHDLCRVVIFHVCHNSA